MCPVITKLKQEITKFKHNCSEKLCLKTQNTKSHHISKKTGIRHPLLRLGDPS
jgi:hypothetical protein